MKQGVGFGLLVALALGAGCAGGSSLPSADGFPSNGFSDPSSDPGSESGDAGDSGDGDGDHAPGGGDGDDSADPPGDPPGKPPGNCSVQPCEPPSGGADGGITDPDQAFAGPTACSSGVSWLLGNVKSELMRPGLACNDCHKQMLVRTFTVAGTVYKTGHEPDDCSGVNGLGSDAKVEVTDAAGKVITLTPNLSGNFVSEEALQFPVTTRVLAGGKVRVMEGALDESGGDCNRCHTEQGSEDAPGRIALP